MSDESQQDRWVRRAGVLLALSYGLGAPIGVALELRSHLFSQRLGLPPSLIYVTSFVQFVCAFGVLQPRYARLAAAALTITTLGAIGSHIRIGSPETAVGAALFTALQVWFGFRSGQASESS
jgi:uncharacterized membrane protein YphA (DoxX/SURF4 family)